MTTYWVSKNDVVKTILEEAINDEVIIFETEEAEDETNLGEVLKYVFNGQHRHAAALRHKDKFPTLPCMIWTRMHPSLCRWLGTKLNNVAGQQMAASYLDKCRVSV